MAIFQNQDAIAASWRKQITAVHQEREAARARGEKTGGYTRRINEMEERLSKLLEKGLTS